MFAIEVPGFNLHDTFKSKQSLMWDMKLTLDGAAYTVVNGSHSCKVSQVKNRILVSGSEEDFFRVWFPYFDLSVDYIDLDKVCGRLCYPIAKASKLSNGVHMLNIDPFEAMLTQVLWWKCDSNEAKRKLRIICDLAGSHKKKNYRQVGHVEHCMIPTYDEFMERKELLEDVLSPRDLNKVVYLYNWFEDLREHLVDSELLSVDLEEVELALKHSNLFKPVQTARIMRDAYGVRDKMCIPKRMWKKVSEATWCDDEEEVNKELNEMLQGKSAYVGLLMQSAYGV